MDKAVTIKYMPTNRAQKRKVKKAFLKVFRVFKLVENSFLTTVFNAGDTWTYNQLYAIHLEYWQTMQKKLAAAGWLDHVKVNEQYFVNNYYPINKLESYVHNKR